MEKEFGIRGFSPFIYGRDIKPKMKVPNMKPAASNFASRKHWAEVCNEE